MTLSTTSSCPAHIHRNEAKVTRERGGVGREIQYPTEQRVGGGCIVNGGWTACINLYLIGSLVGLE